MLGPSEKGFPRRPPGKYTLSIYQVGYRVSDAYAAYFDMGSPAQLTRVQVTWIHAASDGKPTARATITVGADGTFQRELPLRDNDVFLLTLEKPARGTAKTEGNTN